MRRAFCPPRPQPQSPPAPVWRSLVRNWRPVCRAAGAAVLGAEPAPFPSPVPPASGGAGPVRSLRALLWTCSVPLFCERPAVCSGRLIFSLPLAIPQFKLVTHKKLPPIVLRAVRPGPCPQQCRRLLSVPPPLAGGGCGCLGYFFCWELLLGT